MRTSCGCKVKGQRVSIRVTCVVTLAQVPKPYTRVYEFTWVLATLVGSDTYLWQRGEHTHPHPPAMLSQKGNTRHCGSVSWAPLKTWQVPGELLGVRCFAKIPVPITALPNPKNIRRGCWIRPVAHLVLCPGLTVAHQMPQSETRGHHDWGNLI